MKNLKIYKKLVLRIFLIFAFGVTITSCSEDMLDKQPLDAISEDNVFNDPVFLQH